jgi:hypothetical protein
MNERELTRITSNNPSEPCDPSAAETRRAWLAFGALLETQAPSDDAVLETWRRAARRRTAWRGLIASAGVAASVALVAGIVWVCFEGNNVPTENETIASAAPTEKEPSPAHCWDDDWDTQIETVRRRVLLFDVDATTSARCESLPISRRVEALSNELRSDSI